MNEKVRQSLIIEPENGNKVIKNEKENKVYMNERTIESVIVSTQEKVQFTERQSSTLAVIPDRHLFHLL